MNFPFTDESELEYFPLSPTLTRIRIHKNTKPINQILCYPVNVHHNVPQTFSAFKRTAPSSVVVSPGAKPGGVQPPNPPRRKSSRNSHTLRLISTMTVHSPTSRSSKRHEVCFKSGNDNKPSVKVLRDQLANKLRSPSAPKPPASSKTKTDPSARRCCHQCSFSVPPKRTDCKSLKEYVQNRGNSLERTFSSSDKRKVGASLPKINENELKLVQSQQLVSPTEVKKVIDTQRRSVKYPPGTIVKKSTTLLSSAKNGLKSGSNKSLNISVAYSPEGRELLEKTSKTNRKSRNNPVDSTQKKDAAGHKSKPSLKKPENSNKHKKPKRDKSCHDSKKEKKIKPQNSEIVKSKKVSGKTSENESTPSTTEAKQSDVLQSDLFFQHLFLRDSSPTPSTQSKSSYILERSRFFENSNPNHSHEPSVGAIKVYLSHRKPVTESKFKYLDRNLCNVNANIPEFRKVCPTRAPSCRRIQSFKAEQSSRNVYPRAKSAGDAESYLAFKSDRFKELNKFYLSLERLSELERSTLSTDLKPRKRNEGEIIDYDRWKQVRTLERARNEFNTLYEKLFRDQIEKDLLFQPKRVESFRWKSEQDRGLKTKEKSVENIKEHFENFKDDKRHVDSTRKLRLDYEKDIHKPLWRGDSVVNLATKMVERRSVSESRALTTSARMMQSAKQLTQEIGSRLWSSLSMEQVNSLKNQLAEIYSQFPPKKENYSINVVQGCYKSPRSLTIRRNSENEPPKQTNNLRSSSVSTQCLSENEKKQISLSLSKEIKDKLKLKVVLGKETRGAIAAAGANVGNVRPEPQISKSKTPTSETETESSDTSVRTAIYIGDSDSVNKKIDYFEQSKDVNTYIPTIYKAADDVVDCEEETVHKPMVSSQSYADLKELFGECDLLKFATIPLSATRKNTVTRINKPKLRAISISPVGTLSEDSSCENLYRTRSLSPDENRWYLNVIKSGDVKRLARKFEDGGGRRCRSDSDLSASVCNSCELGNVYSLANKYETANRGRSRARKKGSTSPIPKTPLKVDNRYMPHINIISKLARLYPKSSANLSQKDVSNSLGFPRGEVEKLRHKFDISLLGRMYTSSPNVHELRDIAPYLSGSWIAHQYPRRQDNDVKPTSPKEPPSILKMKQSPGFRYEAADRGRHRSWSPSTKQTVKFKGGIA